MDYQPPPKPPAHTKFSQTVQSRLDQMEKIRKQAKKSALKGTHIERYGYIYGMTLPGDWTLKKEGKNGHSDWQEFEQGECTATIYSSPTVFGVKNDLAAFQELLNSSDAQPTDVKKCMEKLLLKTAEIESAEIKTIGRRKVVLLTTYRKGTKERTLSLFMTINGKGVYRVDFDAPEDEYSKQSPAFQKSLETIEWIW